MSKCNNSCAELVQAPYRVVQNIAERDTIPCRERVDGMIVTVVNDTVPYTQYILKDGDPCINSNWKNYTEYIRETAKQTLLNYIGELVDEIFDSKFVIHKTITDKVSQEITDAYLNNKFPNAIEGFKVTFSALGTSFTKIADNKWVLTNNLINKNYG